MLNSVKPRTQKGKGILALSSLANSGEDVLSLIAIVQEEAHIDAIFPFLTFPVFARPAPSVPRHGYFDSRNVKTKEELKALLAEVLEDDPKGEILLCPFYKSELSAIWTPGSLAVGKGHDGATAGKNAVTVPLVEGTFPTAIKAKAGIKPEDWPYLEVIYPFNYDDTLNPRLVQLRGGPRMASVVGNFIPHPVKVKKIIHADPEKFVDTGWEKEIEENEGKDGVVVWHPCGAMTDHFSIHAFAANIPILFDKECPQIGDILEPNEKIKKFDPISMLEGVIAADALKVDLSRQDVMRPYAMAAFSALHNSSAMTEEASKWVGCAATFLLKMGCAALMGEARHLSIKDSNSKPSRETVYSKISGRSINFHRDNIIRLVNIFRYGTWSGAFGGIKWACCGAATITLFNAIRELAVNPSETSAAGVVKALNLVVNQAHNGGWWLNKFIQENDFKLVQKGVHTSILPAAPAFLAWEQKLRSISNLSMAQEAQKIASWDIAELTPPRVNSAKIIMFPKINALEISVASTLLKTKFKPIRVPVPQIKDIEVSDIRKSLYLIESNDGYRIEYRGKTKDGTTTTTPMVLWQDKSLLEQSQDVMKKKLGL